MASFFKDMLDKNTEEFLGDIAEGDWSPVPPAQVAVPQLTPPPSHDSWVSVLQRFGEYLTDEELLIVREQLAS